MSQPNSGRPKTADAVRKLADQQSQVPRQLCDDWAERTGSGQRRRTGAPFFTYFYSEKKLLNPLSDRFPLLLLGDVLLETRVFVSRRLEDKNGLGLEHLVLVLDREVLILVLNIWSWSWSWRKSLAVFQDFCCNS